jgi:ankyrin repeat protein
MKDAVIEGNIATVEEYYGLEYPIAGEEENILHIALQHRQMEMAEYILEKMEDINVQDKNSDGDTPLMLATLANNFRLVERLVDMGAPLNSREN